MAKTVFSASNLTASRGYQMNAAIRGIKGKRVIDLDRPEHDVRGPTLERLEKAADAFDIGDDQQGTRVYFFRDTPLQRFYGRLKSRAGSRETDELTREYTALMKYRNHWHCAGLESSLPSVDLNRIYAVDPSNMVGMAKSERQFDHRKKYREAVAFLGQKPHILLENFACYEWPLHVACSTIGYSAFRARWLVRESASKLAHFWGIG